jgi:hypothetical protein
VGSVGAGPGTTRYRRRRVAAASRLPVEARPLPPPPTIPQDPCASKPCNANGGVCGAGSSTNGAATFSCTCFTGYTGAKFKPAGEAERRGAKSRSAHARRPPGRPRTPQRLRPISHCPTFGARPAPASVLPHSFQLTRPLPGCAPQARRAPPVPRVTTAAPAPRATRTSHAVSNRGGGPHQQLRHARARRQRPSKGPSEVKKTCCSNDGARGGLTSEAPPPTLTPPAVQPNSSTSAPPAPTRAPPTPPAPTPTRPTPAPASRGSTTPAATARAARVRRAGCRVPRAFRPPPAVWRLRPHWRPRPPMGCSPPTLGPACFHPLPAAHAQTPTPTPFCRHQGVRSSDDLPPVCDLHRAARQLRVHLQAGVHRQRQDVHG